MPSTLDLRPLLDLSRERFDACSSVLRLRGELEVYTVARFQEEAVRLSEGGVRRIVLDLTGISFVDSAGISAILGLFRRFRALDGMSLVVPPGSNHTAFHVAQLPRIMPVYPTLEAALAAWSADAAA